MCNICDLDGVYLAGHLSGGRRFTKVFTMINPLLTCKLELVIEFSSSNGTLVVLWFDRQLSSSALEGSYI